MCNEQGIIGGQGQGAAVKGDFATKEVCDNVCGVGVANDGNEIAGGNFCGGNGLDVDIECTGSIEHIQGQCIG